MYCQKCRQPLRLDSSLEDLNPAAYDLLISATSQQSSTSRPPSSTTRPQDQARKALYQEASRNAGPPVFKRHHGEKARDSTMSFIYLTESQVGDLPSQTPNQGSPSATTKKQPSVSGERETSHPAATQGDEIERVNRLFEILSARSDIDHPICVDCTDLLIDEFQKKLDAASKERDAFIQHLRQIEAKQPTEEEIKEKQDTLRKAKADEATALTELRKLEEEKDALDKEILSLEAEARELDKEEEIFWRERNAFATKLADFHAERDSITTKLANDTQLLEKLQRSNVYNDTFCISHDGSFATINGLRLGRLSTKPVDWPEINAAWGHALLLLVTVADKLDYKFHGYEPQAMGSTSRITRYKLRPATNTTTSRPGAPAAPPKKHVLELYSSGDMPLRLTFMHRKFDNAMVAFLELVRQLGAFVERQTEAAGSALTLPYRIEGDKIGDVSIKLGIAQDDGWTKACKLTLTCCKFLLAHASNVSSSTR